MSYYYQRHGALISVSIVEDEPAPEAENSIAIYQDSKLSNTTSYSKQGPTDKEVAFSAIECKPSV
jgi:hypothetical protein